jgi:K+-sensing histidine kinase KdpD
MARILRIGLGLAICKEYAELLGERIEVLSEVDEGTRLEVALPMPASGENVNPPDGGDGTDSSASSSFQIL